jgi:predicted SAM-dependent methyltransferase
MLLKLRKLIKRGKRFFQLIRKEKRKFNIGSAGINPDSSWYATDIKTLDITKERDWRRQLLFLRLDNIMAEHVWEHLNEEHTHLANKNCFTFLKSGGVLRLAVPDGYHPAEPYIEHVRPGGSGVGADDHKILYNYKTMKERLEQAGFRVILLEYWDENKEFHYSDWTDEGGRIMRSSRFDVRNKNGELNYTSLIVDAIKP